MFHTGLKKYETLDVDHFTSDIGIRIRRMINRPWRQVLRWSLSEKCVLERYPVLEKGKAYIFCVNHSFNGDAISAAGAVDRNVYMLHGTTHQMEHNPQCYALWLNGMVYVNRLREDSRKAAIPKMERILRAGSSIMLFPEGGYNNTENQLIQPLFASPYLLSRKLGVEVVPLITFRDWGGSGKKYLSGRENRCPCGSTKSRKRWICCVT